MVPSAGLGTKDFTAVVARERRSRTTRTTRTTRFSCCGSTLGDESLEYVDLLGRRRGHWNHTPKDRKQAISTIQIAEHGGQRRRQGRCVSEWAEWVYGWVGWIGWMPDRTEMCGAFVRRSECGRASVCMWVVSVSVSASRRGITKRGVSSPACATAPAAHQRESCVSTWRMSASGMADFICSPCWSATHRWEGAHLRSSLQHRRRWGT